ncbi:MAG: hypothetical protein ACRCX2_28405 [Paraclostridium sp.]
MEFKYNKVLMNFDNIKKEEKSAEFSYNGKKIMVVVGMNPWSGEVLVSVYLNRRVVVQNVTAVSNEFINGVYCDTDIGGYLCFLPESPETYCGNRVHFTEVGSVFGLYFLTKLGV